MDHEMWVKIAFSSLFGAVGGFGAALLQEKGLEWPRRYKDGELTYLKFGFFADLLIGALAAVIIFALNPPTDTTKLVASTLIAGVGGSAILKGYINGKILTKTILVKEEYKSVANMAMNVMRGDEDMKERIGEMQSRMRECNKIENEIKNQWAGTM